MLTRTLFLIACLSLAWFGCGRSEQTNTDGDTTMTDTTGQDQATQIVLTALSESPDYPNAKLTFTSFQDSSWVFNVSGGDYQLGVQTPDADTKMCANSAKGQHIHHIVDNEPYDAYYEPTFTKRIADGNHTVLAFLSRSYHESIKHPEASWARTVTVENGRITKEEPITGPALFYSRPKGEYIGQKETENVMLDFYLMNVELGTDYRVKADVNGQEFIIAEWKPYVLTGLQMGENTITLTLIDGQGNTVDAPDNPVTRTFTLKADPAETQVQ